MKKLRFADLAAEYGNSRCIIHWDMLFVAQMLPLKDEAGVWELDIIKHHSCFQQILLQAFARNIEIEAVCLERTNISRELVSFAIEYKRLPKKLGKSLSKAILDAEKCRFEYVKPQRTTTRTVDPIKIYTENGRRYVITRDFNDDKVKYLIKNFTPLKGEKQTLTPQMLAEADAMKNIWSFAGAQETAVKFCVRPEIARGLIVKLESVRWPINSLENRGKWIPMSLVNNPLCIASDSLPHGSSLFGYRM